VAQSNVEAEFIALKIQTFSEESLTAKTFQG
jgi:hypothetical protein